MRWLEHLRARARVQRPGLEACRKALQPGNTFVVWKFDRPGRGLKHLLSTVEELRERCVGLRVLAGAEQVDGARRRIHARQPPGCDT